MNKAIPVLGIVVVASAFTFAAIEFRRMSGAFGTLEERVARVETATAPPAGAAPSAGPSTIAGLGEELVKMREDIRQVRDSQNAARVVADSAPPPAAGTGTDAGKPAASQEDMKKAFAEALAAKEKADKEKQAITTRKQMAQSAKSWGGQLAKQLGLTEQQKTQLVEILTEQWTKMSAAWQPSDDENAPAVDYEEMQKETNTMIKQILTPEQATKYDEIMKKQNWWGKGEDEESTENK